MFHLQTSQSGVSFANKPVRCFICKQASQVFHLQTDTACVFHIPTINHQLSVNICIILFLHFRGTIYTSQSVCGTPKDRPVRKSRERTYIQSQQQCQGAGKPQLMLKFQTAAADFLPLYSSNNLIPMRCAYQTLICHHSNRSHNFHLKTIPSICQTKPHIHKPKCNQLFFKYPL